MTLVVRVVETGRDLRRFVDVPWQLHDPVRHPQWVPPLRIAVRDMLDPRKDPFWQRAARQLFVAERDGAVVGRVAAIENRAHNAHHGDRLGFFGFFECADDPEAAAALLDAAAAWLRARGLTAMRGPVNPSTNHECGTLVDGFEHHPMVMTTWNPPYHDALLQRAGLQGVKDLLGWWLPLDDPAWTLPPQYAQQAARARQESGLTFRDLDPSRLEREIAICWDVYNDAWEPNWGYTPYSREEFAYLAKDLKHVVDPNFAFAAEVNGEPAGFMLALRDINQALKRNPSGRLFPTGLATLLRMRRRILTGRVVALGVKKRHRTRAVFALFADEVLRRARAAGAQGAEASWVLEDNHLMNRPLAGMGARPYRRWRLYERALVDGGVPA